jgi:hypothetical protein
LNYKLNKNWNQQEPYCYCWIKILILYSDWLPLCTITSDISHVIYSTLH